MDDRQLSEAGYGRMIRALNEVHYAGETGFYGTASLRPCEERLFERYGRHGRILDAGCGAGRVTRAVAARGGDIVGIDINGAAIAAARIAAPGVEFVHTSMAQMPFRAEEFTNVWCLRFSFNALPTYQERLNTLRELWRVCAPGGVVLVEAFNWYHRGRLGLVRAANLLDHLARMLHRHGGGRSSPLPRRDILYLANKTEGAAPGYAHLTTASELLRLVTAAGISGNATVTSEEALLDCTRTPVRPRHGRYSMWLVLNKTGDP
ncbi:class I SAM-dependent methyltransferase [Rhizomonospora bruguierae]|uniref:class I SAM-dependent methyltransferase n=1 Tax=Rhizomonospora bruguierae TaxID=1581705 RepID=UPI0020BD6981|nr:class I SAM-dependent methyltransferase [Micromonospora sp. NBRC 107566]